MSLRNLSNLGRTLWFRLALWYSAIFAASVFATFFAFYHTIISVVEDREDSDLLSEAKEFSNILASKGVAEVKAAMDIEAESEGVDKIFFRLADLEGQEIASTNMSSWADLGLGKSALKKLAKGDKNIFETIALPGRGYSVRILNTLIGAGVVLQIGLSLEDHERFVAVFKHIFSITMAAMVIIAALVGGGIARWALFGIEKVTATAQEISRGSFDQRVNVKAKVVEIERLARAFNAMLDRIDTLVGGMRDVTDNIAHDLKTPITRIRSSAEMILIGADHPKESISLAMTTLEECDRLLQMVNTILDISEAETGIMKLKRTGLDVSDVMEQVADVYQYVAEDKGIVIHRQYPKGLHVSADQTRLSQAVANLLDNAVKYTPEGNHIYLDAFRNNKEIGITVKDTGRGIPPEDLPRIWDRLYRGDQSRSEKGLGLGLSLVKAVITAHKGRIEVSSEPGKGSTFIMYLPASDMAGIA
ncbi:Integral membrane sensor signal transduction histidine kinase [uncultured Desulfobacterium sp.]|uniref:histidine kinase n=1 Tax=uncultured Desulfobacterium sp. TaxID=201089 RepID=A0A445MWU4_9BACT|nr:Integral membrane sensor signal transduction histidine kinase [uncultured Desulfobacterium sp.]